MEDAVWWMEHTPVFTQGQAGKPDHLLRPGDIPVVQSDRGGQVTYHGPGQLMIYTLLDLNTLQLGIRDYVRNLEDLLVQWMQASLDIDAYGDPDAPGVYQGGAKIASIGLRVRHGFSYHGICLNVTGDLSPFQRINPCGYVGLKMTQLSSFAPDISVADARDSLAPYIADHFSYTDVTTSYPEILPISEGIA